MGRGVGGRTVLLPVSWGVWRRQASLAGLEWSTPVQCTKAVGA